MVQILIVCLYLLSGFCLNSATENAPFNSKLYDILGNVAKIDDRMIENWQHERGSFQDTVLNILEHRKEEMQQLLDVQNETLMNIRKEYDDIQEQVDNITDLFSAAGVNSPCSSNPCLNGKCYASENDYLCVCSAGNTGKHCNESTDYCSSSPCIRGSCTNNRDSFSCVCPPGVNGTTCESIPATDCYDILEKDLGNKSGIYWVSLWQTEENLEVFCDLETDQGGWTVLQRRFDGSVDFYRNFANYSEGFGKLDGEFWLGLRYVPEMTSQGQSELRIDLMSATGTSAYEIYSNFSLSSGPAYTLHIGTGRGTAGDSGSGLSYHNGSNFYTYDQDNGHKCAKIDYGGWWYNFCAHVNLNGQYVLPGTESQHTAEAGMIYRAFQGTKSLKRAQLMFRRTKN